MAAELGLEEDPWLTSDPWQASGLAKDGDGKLSLNEITRSHMQSDSEMLAAKPKVEKNFKIADADGDGLLDKAETEHMQESLLGLHRKMDQLMEVLCGRPAARHTSSIGGKPRRPAADLIERHWDSTSLQEAARFMKLVGGVVVRWRPEGFGFVKVDGTDVFAHVSVVRGPIEGLVGCKVVISLEVDVAKSTGDERKYRVTELHRERDYEEILARTRAEEAAAAAVRAAGEAKQRAEASQDAMEKAALAQLRAKWSRPPGLLATMMIDTGVQTGPISDVSIEAVRPGQQVVVMKTLEALPAVESAWSTSIGRSRGPSGSTENRSLFGDNEGSARSTLATGPFGRNLFGGRTCQGSLLGQPVPARKPPTMKNTSGWSPSVRRFRRRT